MATNPISPWRERLKRRFSPRRIRLGSDQNSPLSGGEGRALECVVGRELCLFTLIDASKVPAKQRAAFVAMAVRRAAPFPDPEFGVAWMGDFAATWYWSRSRVRGLLGSSVSPTTLVPEALLTGHAPEHDGLQRLALAHGHEGRAWKQGRLIASRWWANAPSAAEWQSFARGAGVSAGTDADEIEPAPIQARSWSLQRTQDNAVSLASLETLVPRVMAGVGTVAALVLAFELGAIGQSLLQVHRAESEAASLDEPLRRILTAREQVDQDQAEIMQHLQLRAPRGQLEMMAELTRVMPKGSWQLKQWHQPTIGQLEATVMMSRPDLEALVSAWEASPMFENVRTELSSRQGEVTIKARVVRAALVQP